MKLMTPMMIALTLAISGVAPNIAWADATSNICKPDVNNPDVSNTVMCTWPDDPSVNPVPDVTDCQNKIHTPTFSTDDCGNADFQRCMEDKGFECSMVQSDGSNANSQ
jgi:hypothetical protein